MPPMAPNRPNAALTKYRVKKKEKKQMKKIALISPASPTLTPFDKDAVRSFFKSVGYEPVYGKNAFKCDRFTAGSDIERAGDVMWAFSNPDIDAVMSIRGGYGTPRILDKIDYDVIQNNPKPFFGFSDVTALQLAFLKKAGLVTFTGIQAGFIQNQIPNTLFETFSACLNREPITFENLTPMTGKKAAGILVGGSLTMLTSLCGTIYMPNMTGAILVLEEVGEQPYRIDRMLEQLTLSGALSNLKGVILGGFHNCVSKDKTDGTVDEVLHERFGRLNIPVLKDFHYAHGGGEIVFPLGAKAIIDADNGVLEINEY